MKKLYPVIHYLNEETTNTNIDMALDALCEGVFLINMGNVTDEIFQEAIEKTVYNWRGYNIGVNRLGYKTAEGIRMNISDGVHMSWADYTGIHSDPKFRNDDNISNTLAVLHGNDHPFFGAVAFKYQFQDHDPGKAANMASDLGWIPTTSGPATGSAADVEQLKVMKESIGDAPLALASGVTPYNVIDFLPYVDYFLVATGISSGFHHFDKELLTSLSNKIKGYENE